METSRFEKRQANDERVAQLAAEAGQFNAESRAKVRQILDIVSEEEDFDIDALLRHYARCYARPVLSLAQDIQRQAMVLQNMVEDIKKTSIPPGDEDETIALEIKSRYEKIQLMTVGVIPVPNPHVGKIAIWALDKLVNLGSGFIKLLAEHGKELLQELRFEVGTTATLQVQTGMSWTLTVGVEQTVGMTRERTVSG